MEHEDILQRLDGLTHRLERLERHVGLAPQPEAAKAQPQESPARAERPDTGAAGAVARPDALAASLEARSEALVGAAAREEAINPREPTQFAPPHGGLASLAAAAASPRGAAAAPPARGAAPAAPAGSDGADVLDESRGRARRDAPSPERAPRGPGSDAWERRIGERWLAWVGAVVVVLAVGFFVKLAYDMGWWGRIPPVAKCLLSATLGVALLGSGEAALRRFGGQAAVGLYGAGLGTLYLTAYASFRFYELVSPAAAFWLMFLVACVGIGLTIRSGLRTTGILSLLGGYLSPILLADQQTFPAALPLYITALLVIGLSLSAASAQRFRQLRYVTVVFHAVVAALWTVNEGTQHWLLAMGFLTGWWALLSAEAYLAAVRGQSPRGNCIVSLLATGGYILLGCDVLAVHPSGAGDWLGVFAGGVAAVCTWWALGTGVGVPALRQAPRRALEQFVATLWVQVGVLLAGAIALHFRAEGESFGQTIGWLAMFAACVELGRRLPSRGVSFFGLLVGVLALGRLILMDPELRSLQAAVVVLPYVRIDGWAVLALASVAVWQAAAWRVHPALIPGWRGLPAVLNVLSLLQYLGVAAHCCDGRWVTLAWLLAAVPLLALLQTGQRLAYAKTGLAVLLLTLGRLFTLDLWFASSSPTLLEYSGVRLDVWATVALVSMAAWHAAAWRIRVAGVPRRRWLAPALSIVSVVQFIAVAAHCCAGRWMTLAWVLAAIPLIAWMDAGRRLRYAEAALGLLALATARWLFVDGLDARLTPGWNALAAPVLLNAHMGLAVVLAALAGWLGHRVARDRPGASANAPQAIRIVGPQVAEWLWLGASLLLLVALGFEADRLIGRLAVNGTAGVGAVWPPTLLRGLAACLLADLAGLVLAAVGYQRAAPAFRGAGNALVLLGVLIWLTGATLTARVAYGAVLAWPVVNWQAGAGVVVGLVLAFAWRRWWRAKTDAAAESGRNGASERALVGGLLAAVGLWLGSFEIDRVFAGAWIDLGDPAMARQASLSVFWALYAIGIIVAGFRRAVRGARYAGLAMLLVVLGKVFLVDLAGLEAMYRVASLLLVGLLLLATSLLYARRARREGALEGVISVASRQPGAGARPG